VRPGMMGDGILLQVRVGRRTLRDPMDHLLQKHAFGIFGATWGIININKLNAEACGKTDTWDAWGSERKHGADEAYGQSERAERWAHFKREKGRAFARRRCGFFKLRYHQRCTPLELQKPNSDRGLGTWRRTVGMSVILIFDFSAWRATMEASSNYEEETESEETSDGDFSVITDQEEDGAAPPDRGEDMIA